MSPSLPIFQVDAFTDVPFRGNPAAVCVLSEPASAEWMQSVAQEMNLSETAFLHPEGEGYRLRWFTPKVEVDLCGHATLASACVLWSAGYLSPEATACFETRSGRLSARQEGEWIWLDFPVSPPIPLSSSKERQHLEAALRTQVRSLCRTPSDYLVEVESEAALRQIQPDFDRLTELPARGTIATARSASPTYDFVSRFFAPAAGIDEDPVTGSAHCALAPFWRDRLQKTEFLAYQASERSGVLRVRLAEGDRVAIGGQAVLVFQGQLTASTKVPTEVHEKS